MSQDEPEIPYEVVEEILCDCINRLRDLGLPDIYIAIGFISMGGARLAAMGEDRVKAIINELREIEREFEEGTKH